MLKNVSISTGRKGISPVQITIFPGSSETEEEHLNWRKVAVNCAAFFFLEKIGYELRLVLAVELLCFAKNERENRKWGKL